MGTETLIVVHPDDSHLVPAAQRRIDDLERRWSRFLADSELSGLNANAGMPVIVSSETYALVRHAVDAADHTDGRFDPTVHDSMIALGYDRTFEATIDSVTSAPEPAPGTARIEFDDALEAITLPPDVRLDLGGIGKGAAADLVCDELLDAGARGAAVSVGGDTRVRGESPTGGAWAIEVGGRRADVPTILDGGFCTSGVTGRRWRDGRHHLLDPRTGRSAQSPIETITVIGATATQAEVLAKAAFLCGADAPAYLESHGVSAVVRWACAA